MNKSKWRAQKPKTDNETTLMWREIRERTQDRHNEWYKSNVAILRNAIQEFPFTDKDTTLLFRIEEYPKVDFYPHTGRWKVIEKGKKPKMKTGGANAFLVWMRKQRKNTSQ